MDNNSQKTALHTMALAALGVVFGDIGTSPLYTMKEVFSAGHHPLLLNPENVYGILSLITWALILVVSVKYVAFIMRADNRGEGGIMALLALASRILCF
jgi:KUP system potassium uptake protein